MPAILSACQALCEVSSFKQPLAKVMLISTASKNTVKQQRLLGLFHFSSSTLKIMLLPFYECLVGVKFLRLVPMQ